MLRKLKLLTPAFLQKFDRYLLLNHPTIWATRIHYVLFFGVAAMGLVFLKASLEPVALNDVPNPENGFYLLFLPVILAGGAWAFFVYLFRTDRNYGQVSRLGELSTQLIYMLGLMVLLSIPFVYGLTLVNKVENAITEAQLQEDLYALNLGEAFLSSQHPDRTADWETFLVVHFEPNALSETNYQRLIHDLQHADPAEQYRHVDKFLQTFAKYSEAPLNLSTARVMENFGAGIHSFPDLTYDERFYQVEDNLSRLVRAKQGNLLVVSQESANMLLFSLLFVAFAFVIFVRSNWKQFLFALGASIVSGILLAIFAELADEYVPAFYDVQEVTLFSLGLLGLVLFLVFQVYSRRNSKGFMRWKSVSLIMAAGLMPLLFLVSLISLDVNSNFVFEPRREEFSIFVLGIFGLTFLLWNLFFSKRFRDIQSAPTSN